MKEIGSFTRKLVGCGAALLATSLLFDAQAQTMKEGQGVVRSVRGQAQYSTGGGVWVPLRNGTTLTSGSTVRTAAESTVDIALGVNGPVLRVSPATTVALDRLAFSGSGSGAVVETQLNLQNGEILGNVRKLASASRYEIKTPNAVAGIRGSSYRARTRNLGGNQWQSEFTCIEGLMTIADASGATTVVANISTDETYITGTGTQPLDPQERERLIGNLKDIDPPTDPTTPTPDLITFNDPVIEEEEPSPFHPLNN